MFTRIWLAAAGTRALRTLAQVAVATIGTTAVIDGVDWRVVASTAGLAAILSLLTSLAGLPEVTEPVVPEAAPRHVADDGHARWQETTTEAEADAQAAGNDRTAFPYA